MFVSSVFCFQWFCFLFCFWWGDLKWGIPWWVLAKVCEIFLKSFLFSFFFWIFWVFDDSWYLCYLMSFWCSLGLLTALCLVPEKMEDNKVMSRVKRLLVLFLKAENKPNDCFELTWSNLRIKVLFLFLFDIKILNFFLVHFPHYSFLSVGHSIFFFFTSRFWIYFLFISPLFLSLFDKLLFYLSFQSYQILSVWPMNENECCV